MNVKKNNIIIANTFVEANNIIQNLCDSNIYVEPDGSLWTRIVHHNNPSVNIFASTDPFDYMVYKSEDLWFNAALCNSVSGPWEMMVKEKQTSTSDELKYRWIQPTNPMTPNYFEETKIANIVRIIISGYNTSVSYGGAFILNNNTYLCCNNGNSGNWYGAFGAWTRWNSGIPGYATSAITTGYMDLYLRIDNYLKKDKMSIGNDFINTYEVNEVH